MTATAISRSLFVLVPLLVARAASAQGVLYSDDFEAPSSDWIYQGIWHRESSNDPCGGVAAPFPRGPHAAYCGRTGICDYDAAPHDHALLAAFDVAIPPTGRTYLRYWSYLETEDQAGTPRDLTRVLASTNGGTSWQPFANDFQVGGADRNWRRSRVSLQPLAGQTVRLGFGLSTDSVADGYFGWLVDGVEIRHEPGEPYCELGTPYASGAIPCPCGNGGPATQGNGSDQPWAGGCLHRRGYGAELVAEGSTSLAAGDAVLVVRDLPWSTSVLVAVGRANATPTTFGDGVRCLGGDIERIARLYVTGGEARFPAAGGASLAALAGAAVPGGASCFQILYREVASYCTPSTFNGSNGYRMVWTP